MWFLEGDLLGGDSSGSMKAYRKHVLLLRVKNSWHMPIVFTHEDEDALVIFIILFNYNVYKILIDDGYVVNILLEDAMIQIDVDLTKLTYIKTSL